MKVDKIIDKYITEEFKKPWEKGAAAYYEIDNFKELVKGFKGFKKMQGFILSDKGVEKLKPKCDGCGEIITTKGGNRGEYEPRTKKYVIYHYKCAWENIFKAISDLGHKLGY